MTLKRSDSGASVIRLSCRAEWAQAYPQSAHLLREEVQAWEKLPCKFEVKGL
jgi:exopolyphosphatase/guanosine-5'-triphosphate,3'-diphosphate pyrophosphatase